MTNLDSILKSRGMTLLTKVCIVKAMVFPVAMAGCESWTIKRLTAKELMLSSCGAESLLDCKEIKPVNPKENQPWIFIRRTDAGAEAPILWPHGAKNQLFRKDAGAGKGWRQKKKGVQRIRWWDSITNSMNKNLSKLQEIVEDRGPWHAAVCGVPKDQTWLSGWTTTSTVNTA